MKTLALIVGVLCGALSACRTSGPSVDANPPPDGMGDLADGDAAALRDEAGGSVGPGACLDDNDCVFRLDSGCCGVCLAQRDTPPPALACGTTCPPFPPACLCVQGRCATGNLPRNAGCDPRHDLCGRGLKCCTTCDAASPAPPDAGGNCTNPTCVAPTNTGSGPQCPMPA